MPAKVTGDSLLIHEFTYPLFIGLRSVTSNMTDYSHSYHSIKLNHCPAPQRDVLSDKMVVARYYAPERGHLRLSFYLENEKKSPEPRF